MAEEHRGAHCAWSASHSALFHGAEVHCGHVLPVRRWESSPSASKEAGSPSQLKVFSLAERRKKFLAVEKKRQRKPEAERRLAPLVHLCSSRGPQRRAIELLRAPADAVDQRGSSCTRELEQASTRASAAGRGARGGRRPQFSRLREHLEKPSSSLKERESLFFRAGAFFSLTVRAWRRRGPRRRPCVPWGRPRAWTGRGWTASLRRGGGGSGGGEGMRSALKLRERKSGERVKSREKSRAKKKKKNENFSSPPKPFLQLTLDFFLLFLLLSAFKRKWSQRTKRAL